MSSSTASATTTPATTSNKNHNNENTRPEQKRTGRRRRIAVGKDESTNEEEEDYVDKDEDENTENFNNWKDFSPASPSSQRATFSFGANDTRFHRNDWRRHGIVHLLACACVFARSAFRVLACAFMNIFCLGVYGVLQEPVMTIPYESSKNNDELGTQYPDAIFASSIFLVLSNRVCALFVGGVALFYTSSAPSKASRHHPFSKKKYWWWPDSSLENYACVAFSSVGGSVNGFQGSVSVVSECFR